MWRSPTALCSFAFFYGSVLGQQLSSCVINCSLSAAAAAGCATSDTSCLCNSVTYSTDATKCLDINCTVADREAALSAYEQLCGSGQPVSSSPVVAPSPTSISPVTTAVTEQGGLTETQTITTPGATFTEPSETTIKPVSESFKATVSNVEPPKETILSNKSESTNHTGAIVGGSVGGGAGGLLAAFGGWACWRKKKQGKKNGENGNEHVEAKVSQPQYPYQGLPSQPYR